LEAPKICLITSWKKKCGIFFYSRDLANALAKLGCEVYIHPISRFGVKSPQYMEYFARRLPKEANLIAVQHEYGIYQELEENLYRLLKGYEKPIVTTMHSAGNFPVDEVVAKFSDRVIVHNNFCKRLFKHDCVVIPHGVTPQNPLPAEEAKKSLGINGPTIGMHGFISTYKGIELAIEVAKELGVTLLVSGGWHIDVETQYMEKLKGEAGSSVKWLGWTSKAELPKVFGAMDVVVFAHHWITASGALLTALGFGKCVLASSLPPCRELERRGVLITFRDRADCIKKLKMLFEDEQMRLKYEEGARKYAKRTAWFPNVARQHLRLYRNLLCR
jgi:glycosyltransferase involved in cell wall biosynthesis